MPPDVNKVLKAMLGVRGLSLGERTAECLVRNLNFVQTHSYLPRLRDLGEEMGVKCSRIVRMEKDLQKANLMRHDSRRKPMFSRHVTVGQGVAAFWVLTAYEIENRSNGELGVTATGYDGLSHSIFEEYKAALHIENSEELCKKGFERTFLGRRGEFDLRRWHVEKLVFKQLCFRGLVEYRLPESFVSDQLSKSGGQGFPDLYYAPRGFSQNPQIAQCVSVDKRLYYTSCSACGAMNFIRLIPENEDGQRAGAHFGSCSVDGNVTE